MRISGTGRSAAASAALVALWAAMAAGPAQAAETAAAPVEPAVVVLFVPLCFLLLAIVIEAARLILREERPEPKPLRPARLPSWRPSAGRG